MSDEFEKAPLSVGMQLFCGILKMAWADQMQQITLQPDHDIETAIAVHAQAMGDVIGAIQAAYEVHGKDCADCAKRRSDFRALFYKNFNEQHANARKRGHDQRNEQEAEAEKHVADLMAKVMGGGHK